MILVVSIVALFVSIIALALSITVIKSLTTIVGPEIDTIKSSFDGLLKRLKKVL